MRRDIELYDALYPIWLALNQLQAMVGDTYLVASSEAYAGSLPIYKYAKASGDVAGEASLTELKRQFVHRGRKKGTDKKAP
ncbi:hypothetical protein [Leptolyngbya sp. FACHB-261]|uniref:hypothetical protein n=1 Tax=Leptolyngbya sp. FACHB-261 TaxID=2692806 RepID=UPI001688EF87|nr:hypothetical protein [Leptolyngbya sp. FACHB-261]MBD2105146.1 hypothetical protein [Leptolyngbya sp. FACHB-261]